MMTVFSRLKSPWALALAPVEWWTVCPENQREKWWGKLLSTQDFPVRVSLGRGRPGSSLETWPRASYKLHPLSQSSWAPRTPLFQKHSMIWSLGRNGWRVWRAPCPLGGWPPFSWCLLTSHGISYPGNLLGKTLFQSFVLRSPLSILLLIMTLFRDDITLQRVPQIWIILRESKIRILVR